jgi:hypothetical protein
MIGSFVLSFSLVYPLFYWLVANPSLLSLTITQVVLCSSIGMLNGPISTAVAEQFPVLRRSTCLGVSYNFAVMIFGGFAQVFVTWLIEVTGLPVAPAFYLMFGAAMGLVATVFLVDRARDIDTPRGIVAAPAAG